MCPLGSLFQNNIDTMLPTLRSLPDLEKNFISVVDSAPLPTQDFVTGRLEIADIIPYRNFESRKVSANKYRHETCVAALPSVVLGTFCGDL
ncbi:hypothetical protein TSMEX_006550 [Taenia solium]|eukprot:TsM_000682500 transcript=TsM_000682500 gene=TsM_000682500